EGRLDAGGIAAGAESLEAGDLRALDLFVDAKSRNGAFFSRDEVVDANDDLLFFLDGALEFERDPLDFALNKTGFDGAQHAAQRVNPGDVFLGTALDFVGQMLDGVRTCDRINRVGPAGFASGDLL